MPGRPSPTKIAFKFENEDVPEPRYNHISFILWAAALNFLSTTAVPIETSRATEYSAHTKFYP